MAKSSNTLLSCIQQVYAEPTRIYNYLSNLAIAVFFPFPSFLLGLHAYVVGVALETQEIICKTRSPEAFREAAATLELHREGHSLVPSWCARA